MNLASLSQVLGNAFSAKKSIDHKILNKEGLDHLRATLYKIQKASPDNRINDDDGDVLSPLCHLRIELNDTLDIPSYSNSRLANIEFKKELEEAILNNSEYKQLSPLSVRLDELAASFEIQWKGTRKKNRVVRQAMMLLSAIPIAGYGLHYFTGNFYQPMFVDQMHMVYPDNLHRFDGQKLQIREHKLEEALLPFNAFYFRDAFDNGDFFGVENYDLVDNNFLLEEYLEDSVFEMQGKQFLPSSYNLSFLGLLDENLNIEATKIPQQVDPFGLMSVNVPARKFVLDQYQDMDFDQREAFHFNKLRVFIKNIKGNHLVNNIRVEVEAPDHNNFPWHLMSIEPKFETQIYASQVTLGDITPAMFSVVTSNAPAKNFSYTINAMSIDNTVLANVKGEMSGYLDSYESELLTFPSKVISVGTADIPLLSNVIYITAQKRAELLAKGTSIESIKILPEDDFLSLIDVPVYEGNAGAFELYIECDDGGLVFFGDMKKLQLIANIHPIKEYQIDYSYQLISNESVLNQRQKITPNNDWLLVDGLSHDFDLISACIGDDNIYSLFFSMVGSTSAAYMTLRNAHGLALLMMDKDKTPNSTIVFKTDVLFSNLQYGEVDTITIDKPMIFNDGDYIQLDLWAFNFQGGDYKINFYINDQQVDSKVLNILWPEETNFVQHQRNIDFEDDTENPF
jgi:hypothetical protein